MLQDAAKCTISKENMPKIFWGEAQPLPRSHVFSPPTGEGDTPSPDPTTVGAFGASIRVPSAFNPLQTTFLDTGLARSTSFCHLCWIIWNSKALIGTLSVRFSLLLQQCRLQLMDYCETPMWLYADINKTCLIKTHHAPAASEEINRLAYRLYVTNISLQKSKE